MIHRIRSAAIIVKDNAVLLVKHRFPERGGFECWVPPGGGLDDGESIYDCAKRETYEETGLTVELGPIIYLREFVEVSKARHHFEIYILATSFSGELTMANIPLSDPDFAFIKEVQFLTKHEMQKVTVFPEVLKEKFWQDLSSGKRMETQYLGQQRE